MLPFTNILVATDFGDSSRAALDFAIELTKKTGARLTVLHAWEVPLLAYNAVESLTVEVLASIEDAAREDLDATLAEVQKQVPRATSILKRGVPWREIIDVIEQTKPDLVVIGTHGRRGISRALLGSVAEKIVRMSPSPVLTVRAKP